MAVEFPWFAQERAKLERGESDDWEFVLDLADRIVDRPEDDPEDDEVLGAESLVTVYLSDFLAYSKPTIDELLNVFGIPADKSSASDYYVALQSSNSVEGKFTRLTIDSPSGGSLRPNLLITIDRKNPATSRFTSTADDMFAVDPEDESLAGRLIDELNSDPASPIRAKLAGRLLDCLRETLNHYHRRLSPEQVMHLLAG